MKKIIAIFLIFPGIFIFSGKAEAHQPRLVFGVANSEQVPYIISNPDISQAFYGEFKNGSQEFYKVSLPAGQDLYLGLLVPDSEDAAKEVSAIVIKSNSPEGRTQMYLNGRGIEWSKYYEEYAGDNYFKGPEQTKNLPAGDYMIMVSARDNMGKYVLVVGTVESFPPDEAVKTLIALPSLKMDFFGASFFSTFNGIIGRYLLVGLVIFFFLILALYSRGKSS